MNTAIQNRINFLESYFPGLNTYYWSSKYVKWYTTFIISCPLLISVFFFIRLIKFFEGDHHLTINSGFPSTIFFLYLLIDNLNRMNLGNHISKLKKIVTNTDVASGIDRLNKILLPKYVFKTIIFLLVSFIFLSLFISSGNSNYPSWETYFIIFQFLFYIICTVFGIWYFINVKGEISRYEEEIKSSNSLESSKL